MQRVVYALGTVAAVLFALMGGLFATGHSTSAIWFLCAGILFSFFAAIVHWRDHGQPALSPPTPPANVNAPTSHVPAVPPRQPDALARPEVETFEPDAKDIEVLRYLYRDDVDRLPSYIADEVHLDRTETKFRLNRLASNGFVRPPGRFRPGRIPQYRLADKGVAFLLKMDNRILYLALSHSVVFNLPWVAPKAEGGRAT